MAGGKQVSRVSQTAAAAKLRQSRRVRLRGLPGPTRGLRYCIFRKRPQLGTATELEQRSGCGSGRLASQGGCVVPQACLSAGCSRVASPRGGGSKHDSAGAARSLQPGRRRTRVVDLGYARGSGSWSWVRGRSLCPLAKRDDAAAPGGAKGRSRLFVAAGHAVCGHCGRQRGHTSRAFDASGIRRWVAQQPRGALPERSGRGSDPRGVRLTRGDRGCFFPVELCCGVGTSGRSASLPDMVARSQPGRNKFLASKGTYVGFGRGPLHRRLSLALDRGGCGNGATDGMAFLSRVVHRADRERVPRAYSGVAGSFARSRRCLYRAVGSAACPCLSLRSRAGCGLGLLPPETVPWLTVGGGSRSRAALDATVLVLPRALGPGSHPGSGSCHLCRCCRRLGTRRFFPSHRSGLSIRSLDNPSVECGASERRSSRVPRPNALARGWWRLRGW
ncbi:hypothetical protein HRbin30_02986 [bacterium HR30]|nr:hypothetical protein HRbin30_02986 [bacterium HR30]